MLKGKQIAVIGGGKMGSVIIGGIVSRKLAAASDVTVSDKVKECLKALKEIHGVGVTGDNKKAAQKADVVVLAVKPQDMAGVLQEIDPVIDNKKLLVSIAAGIPTGFIEGHLRDGIRVIRVMPNTPALICSGVSAVTKGKNARNISLYLAKDILTAIGAVVEVDEKDYV